MRAGCINLEKNWKFLSVGFFFQSADYLRYLKADSDIVELVNGQQINRISTSASLQPQRGGLFSSGWEGDEHHPSLLTSVIVLYARVLKYHLSELQQVLLMPPLNLSAIGVIHSGAGSFCLFETRINWSIPIGLQSKSSFSQLGQLLEGQAACFNQGLFVCQTETGCSNQARTPSRGALRCLNKPV